VIIDPSGKTLRVSRQWHRMAGLAWASGDELWYSAGERLSTGIQAIPLRGPERSVYEALSEIGLHDISADGRVLVGQGLFERDISFLGEGTTTPRSLAWFERDYPSRLSPDGRWMLSSGWNPQIRMIAMLRGTSGELPAILGEGYAQDLSPDGRTALLVPESTAALILRATRGETRREVPLPGFDVSTTRFAGGTDRAISVARTKSDKGYRLYSVDLRTGAVAPLSEDVVEEDHLEVSPHGRWAAVRISSGGQLVPAIVALSDGKASVMSGLGPDLSPSGWASDSELWLSRLDRSTFKLIRYDVERRRVTLEKPTVDLGGSGNVIWVRVTPDGRNTLFGQTRGSGHLYVIRGLIPVH
jgi:hypothetical protein